MGRYYFDLRDSEGLAVDEEGLELQDLQAVQEEATLSWRMPPGIASADLMAPSII